MKNLTYQAYTANPALRAQLEREVRRMRAEAVHTCFTALSTRLVRLVRPAHFPQLKSA